MELFKYRNLAFGCCFFLLSLFFSFYMSFIFRIVALALAVVAILLLSLVFVLSHQKRGLFALCHYTPASIFVIIAMIISIACFDGEEIYDYCDGNLHNVDATVEKVIYQEEYFGHYEIKLHTVDGKKQDSRVKLTLYHSPLSRGDKITVNGFFEAIKSSPIGFDERLSLLSEGITVSITSEDCTVTGHSPTPLLDFFDVANSTLDKRLTKITDSTTYSLLSAMFLGNKANLPDALKRDFSRAGLSHILALSGMHITIIVTIMGLALSTLRLRKIYKELLLIFSTLAFVGITGFASSALRAGLMVCIVYTMYFFGNRTSMVSALLYSVTLICIFDPHSIFSISLWLSFSAMLGCIISSKFIHRVGFFNKYKSKILRFVFCSFVSSVFAVLFTMPIISAFFGSLSLLSPFTNIIISPLLTLVIYLCPVFLLLADVPLLTYITEMTLTGISRAATFLVSIFASADGIVLPIRGIVQICAVFTATVFLVTILFVKRRYLLHCSCCLGASVIAFIVGSIIFYAQRYSNVYISSYNLGQDDIVALEDMGELSVFDITRTNISSYTLSYSVATYLGYSEIDNYVIMDYSEKSHICFDRLSDNTVVKRIFVPLPSGDEEEDMFVKIESIALEKGIEINTVDKLCNLKSVSFSCNSDCFLPRSARRAVAFSLDYQNTKFTYLGAASFEITNDFAERAAHSSDILIFGAYGPKFKVKYGYRVPHLDFCVFYGESDFYAHDIFYNEAKEKIAPVPPDLYRFRISP